MSQYSHRHATYADCPVEARRKGQPCEVQEKTLVDKSFTGLPRYWMPETKIDEILKTKWDKNWLLSFRNISRSTDERTMIATILPLGATDFTLRVALSAEQPIKVACLLANFNSLSFDYVARQFMAGTNFSDYVTKQLPAIPPEAYSPEDIEFISSRVLELVYTAWDMQPFAQDMGYDGEPFIWDSQRRALLRAELDAYYAKLYGLTRDELRYILDPADIYGSDFPSETFRVLKNNEIKQFGEYRTQRLVLEAWDKMTS
jgi:hypothetical protein